MTLIEKTVQMKEVIILLCLSNIGDIVFVSEHCVCGEFLINGGAFLGRDRVV